jgi:hypothetical protein
LELAVDAKEAKERLPLIYVASKMNRWTVREALLDNTWVYKIYTSIGLTMEHIVEYVDLWAHLDHIRLRDDAENDITGNSQRKVNTRRSIYGRYAHHFE